MSKLKTLMKLAPFAIAAFTAVKGSQMRDRYRRGRSPYGSAYGAAAQDQFEGGRDYRRSGTASQVLRKVADMLDKGRR
jgi:hypothetical protein